MFFPRPICKLPQVVLFAIMSSVRMDSSTRRQLLKTVVVVQAALLSALTCADAQRPALVEPSTLFQTLGSAGQIVTCAVHPRTGRSVLVQQRASGFVAVRSASRARCKSFNQLQKNRGGNRAVSEKSLRLGVLAPSALVLLTGEQIERMALAVAEASYQAGVARTTGTLTQISRSPLQYNYSPQPTDRLRGVQLDGAVYEFVVQEMQGDLSSGALSFFLRDHRLVFRAVKVGESDITIEDIEVDGVRTVRVTGSGVFDGTLLTVDVTGQGTEVDELIYRTTLTGRIAGEGIAINVSEVSDSAQQSMSYGFATKIQEVYRRVINTSWRVGATTFVLRNGLISAKFKGGTPKDSGDPTRWFAKGTLRVGGKNAGRLSMVRKSGGIAVVLQAGKASTVLQSWRL